MRRHRRRKELREDNGADTGERGSAGPPMAGGSARSSSIVRTVAEQAARADELMEEAIGIGHADALLDEAIDVGSNRESPGLAATFAPYDALPRVVFTVEEMTPQRISNEQEGVGTRLQHARARPIDSGDSGSRCPSEDS